MPPAGNAVVSGRRFLFVHTVAANYTRIIVELFIISYLLTL
jgi:hypothetical protein